MKKKETHVIVGAGVAGCLSALARSRAGYRTVLLEKQVARSRGTYPVCTQTSNIVSENHSGAEYPYDPQSARDCLDGRIANERIFPESIYAGKTYSRIIASASMVEDGQDIIGQCRSNMEVIRSHYSRRCDEDSSNAVFGDPARVCREVASVSRVNDVAAAFITPQRGMNPGYVADHLERSLRDSGVGFREGTEVADIERLGDGRYQVETFNVHGMRERILADQISLCSATAAFRQARKLCPTLRFPRLFMALRTIFYVDLPDGTEKNFTCLKLEDAYGGMFSPLNDEVAMVYHPPAAHIMNAVMDPDSCGLPEEYERFLRYGHPEAWCRSQWALSKLRMFYPELRRSSILDIYLKVAINTVSDSRVRRNIGVFKVQPGCTLTVLPKWTMCAVNARRELALALEESVSRQNIEPEEAEYLLAQGVQPPFGRASAQDADRAQDLGARDHALNMGVPSCLARRFNSRRPSRASGEMQTRPAVR